MAKMSLILLLLTVLSGEHSNLVGFTAPVPNRAEIRTATFQLQYLL